jgi:AcrR family transcriptional regulator
VTGPSRADPGHDQRGEPRWRRLEPDERRRQILACAVRLFGARAYADVSTTDIAREAGVARGLVNHYFGTKKGLYVEVVRTLVTMPAFAADELPRGDLAERVDAGVAWFVDVVSRHSRPWLVAVTGGAGGHDAEVAAVLAEADEVTADTLLRLVGADPSPGPERDRLRAVLRAYSGFGKAATQEWLGRGALDREQVRLMLTTTLLALVRDVFPEPMERPAPQ